MKDASVKLMLAIAAAMAVAPNYAFSDAKSLKELIDGGFAVQNPEIPNPGNATELATRLTDAGMAEAVKAGYKPAAAPVPTFVIRKVEAPKINRTANTANAKYPFDKLDNGESFFIAAPAGMKSPSKSFGSLVSTRNTTYKRESDFRHFYTRSVDGAQWDQPGVKGVAIFRDEVADEAKAKAKAFPAAK